MNIVHLDYIDAAYTVANSSILHSCDRPGGITEYVAHYLGRDVLIYLECVTGSATLIDANDALYGGSVHDFARAAIAAGTL